MRPRALEAVLAALYLLALGLAFASVVFLQHRFAGYDLSPLIDAGWRVLSGQAPGRDFICTFPPLLYLGAALAFRAFGVTWLALSIAGAVLPLLLLAAGFRLLLTLRGILREGELAWLAFVYAALHLAPLLADGHPWHSFWTESASLYALLSTFALCLGRPVGRIRPFEPVLHCTVAVTLLLLAKPNVSMLVLLCALAAMLLARRPVPAALSLLGGFVLASLALAAVHTDLFTTFHVYRQLTGRFLPGHYLEFITYNKNISVGLQRWAVYAVMVPVGAWLVLHILRPASGVPGWLRLLAAGAAATALIGIGTNVDFNLVDAPCLILAGGLVLMGRPAFADVGRIAVVGAAYMLLALGTYYGLSRTRMQQVGIWAQDPCGGLARMDDSFFGHLRGCRTLPSVLAETDAALAHASRESVFFGPRLEFLYAREHLASPKGLPLWWHPGSSYPLSAAPAIDAAFAADAPRLVVLMHNDRTLLPDSILSSLQSSYTPVPVATPAAFADLAADPNAQIDVLVRRPDPVPASHP